MVREETVAQLNMFMIFIVANLLALVLMPAYMIYQGSMGNEENNPWVAVFYVLYIIGVTAVILYIAKKKKTGVLKAIFYFAVAWSMWFALFPIFYYFSVPASDLISLTLSIVMTILLIKYPEWYMMNLTGILMAVGIALIFGISFGMIPVVVFLAILAIYDAVSVYKTKHMVSLADNVIEHNLPALFILPAKSDFSYKHAKSPVKKKTKKKERDAYYMGFGDVMIPGIMVVSAARNYGLVAGVFTLIGAVLAMILLTAMVNSGKPQPGLPYLNGGALAGFIIYLFLF